MKRSLLSSLLALCAIGCHSEPQRLEQPSLGQQRVERMATLCATHHEVPREVLEAFDDEDLRVLHALARDAERPLWVRSRAVSLAGARPSAETEALWRDLRRAPEEELRVQAAWAAGLARRGEERLTYSSALLVDDDVAVREAGAHLLALSGGEQAVAVARARVLVEPDPRVRAVLIRRVLRDEVSRAPPSGG